jgi:hypothetical protein
VLCWCWQDWWFWLTSLDCACARAIRTHKDSCAWKKHLQSQDKIPWGCRCDHLWLVVNHGGVNQKCYGDETPFGTNLVSCTITGDRREAVDVSDTGNKWKKITVYFKGKEMELSQCLTDYSQSHKGVWRSERIDLHILHLNSSWRCVASFTPRPLNHGGKSPSVDRRLHGVPGTELRSSSPSLYRLSFRSLWCPNIHGYRKEFMKWLLLQIQVLQNHSVGPLK